MADVTISSLPLGTPSSSALLPYSQDGNTLSVSPSALLQSVGNIGIGTSNPQATLDVNGTVKASGLNVPGIIIQSVFSSVIGGSLGTPTNNNTFPYSANALTQPQGSKFLSVSITPKQANSSLFITVNIPTIAETTNHSDTIGYGIWKDGNNTPINLGWSAPTYNPSVPSTVNNVTSLYFTAQEQSGSIISRTYSFYSAWNNGPAILNTVASGYVLYNNVVTSFIRVDEIAA